MLMDVSNKIEIQQCRPGQGFFWSKKSRPKHGDRAECGHRGIHQVFCHEVHIHRPLNKKPTPALVAKQAMVVSIKY